MDIFSFSLSSSFFFLHVFYFCSFHYTNTRGHLSCWEKYHDRERKQIGFPASVLLKHRTLVPSVSSPASMPPFPILQHASSVRHLQISDSTLFTVTSLIELFPLFCSPPPSLCYINFRDILTRIIVSVPKEST